MVVACERRVRAGGIAATIGRKTTASARDGNEVYHDYVWIRAIQGSCIGMGAVTVYYYRLSVCSDRFLERLRDAVAVYLDLVSFLRDRDSPRNEDPSMLSHTSTISSSRASGYLTNRMRVDRGERLPGSVLQARARLLERLRGTSVAGSRQRNHAQDESGSSSHPATSDYLMFIESGGDWETESPGEWLESMNLYGSSRSLAQSWEFSSETNEKPPGLSRVAINHLQRGFFKANEGIYVDCPICLERFVVGEGLIHLPCGHSFHPSCLDPWITACGDCPYCRAPIQMDSG